MPSKVFIIFILKSEEVWGLRGRPQGLVLADLIVFSPLWHPDAVTQTLSFSKEVDFFICILSFALVVKLGHLIKPKVRSFLALSWHTRGISLTFFGQHWQNCG